MSRLGAEARDELEIRNVGKRYAHTVAVDDVSLSVRQGEFLTILGPSGSGKTTLLHMIAGFVFPTAGTIVYRGAEITYMPAHLRSMGMVFQNYALFPHMTVAQNLEFPLRMRRVAHAEGQRRVRETLELVGLASQAGRMPAQLSGGQQQRVAVARALVYRPSLLLMDEPLGALDKYLRERLQREIKRIQRATGVTILYVTHDQQEALAMSDRIAVMSEGRIRTIGTAREIYERPATRFIAEFIGDCNVLSGRVLRVEGGACDVAICPEAMVRVPGVERSVGEGSSVTLCVRPESISVTPGAEGSGEGRAGLRGRISDVIYLGDIVKYEIAVPDLDSSVRVLAKSLKAARMAVFSRGDGVVVSWSLDDAWLIDDTSH